MLARQVGHEKGRALEDRDDDERAFADVAIDGPADGLDAIGDQPRFVAALELHEAVSESAGLSIGKWYTAPRGGRRRADAEERRPAARNGSGGRPRSGSPRRRRAVAGSARARGPSWAAGRVPRRAGRAARGPRAGAPAGRLGEKGGLGERRARREAQPREDLLGELPLEGVPLARATPRSRRVAARAPPRRAPRARAERGFATGAGRRWRRRGETECRAPRGSAGSPRARPKAADARSRPRATPGARPEARGRRGAPSRAGATRGRRLPGAPWRCGPRPPRRPSRGAPRSARAGRPPPARGEAPGKRRGRRVAATRRGGRAGARGPRRTAGPGPPRGRASRGGRGRRRADQPGLRRDLGRAVEQRHRVGAPGDGQEEAAFRGESARRRPPLAGRPGRRSSP